jgi:hypothetical protein
MGPSRDAAGSPCWCRGVVWVRSAVEARGGVRHLHRRATAADRVRGEEHLDARPRLPRSHLPWAFPREWSADGERMRRFASEADRAAMLDHPHILGMRDRGEDAGQPSIGGNGFHEHG